MSSYYVDIGAQMPNKTSLLRTYSSQLLLNEAYSIRHYHHKRHVFTGLPVIDAIHRHSLQHIATYLPAVHRLLSRRVIAR